MYKEILSFIKEANKSVEISDERLKVLEMAVNQIRNHFNDEQLPSLVFVCTHNSRRSQFSHIWAEVLAYHHGMNGHFTIQSAGTEKTACNPRTIASLDRAGFDIATQTTGENPVYHCRFAEDAPPVKLWSKTLDDEAISRPLISIMTCSHADENCPFVPGAVERIKLMYDDPKISDDTPDEEETYDERSMQIAAELFWIFSKLKADYSV